MKLGYDIFHGKYFIDNNDFSCSDHHYQLSLSSLSTVTTFVIVVITNVGNDGVGTVTTTIMTTKIVDNGDI